MRIPFKYIQDAIYSDTNMDDISDKLFQLGHEHTIEHNIFEMEFTPNRGDCLSLKGLLRDLSVFYKLKNHSIKYNKSIDKFDFNFVNNYEEACPFISFLKIEIENDIKPYKKYLNDYFEDLKVNKVNFFTDISNYLMFECGQPTHCYDAKKLGSELTFEQSRGENNFKTLFGDEINLNENDAVFVSNNEIINLAGVIGGESTSCSKLTRDVIVECAYFNPEKIIGKTVNYDVKSDAAYKFERGVDPLNHEETLRRFTKIVEDHSEIKNLKLYTYKNKGFENTVLVFDVKNINKILGTNISKKQYLDHLTRLGFTVSNNKIIVPSYRNDIAGQNDLAEEIARVVGYNNIENSKISIKKINTDMENKGKIEEKLKSILIDNGFYEVINYPFSKEINANSIIIDNPLDTNKNSLRVNLKKSLINNLLFNERRQKDSVKLFEISDIYKYKEKLNIERYIGIIASGRVGKNYLNFSRPISENYLNEIIRPFLDEPNMIVSQISRDSLDSKIKNKIFYIEIKISDISNNILKIRSSSRYPKNYISYREISEFPHSVRDISLSIKDFKQLKLLESSILSYSNKILKEVFVFDFYENEVKEELKVGFRFVFQSKDCTLTDNEVDKVLNDIINLALSFNSVEIPGLNSK